MGVGSSATSSALDELDGEERYFGLENHGNTCYCNSVLQALYFCPPLRKQLLAAADESGSGSAEGRGGSSYPSAASTSTSSLLSPLPLSSGRERRRAAAAAAAATALPEGSLVYELAELFSSIRGKKKRNGCLAPTEFLRTLRERNELFRGQQQQDAHEFLNVLLNDIGDTLVDQRKKQNQTAADAAGAAGALGAGVTPAAAGNVGTAASANGGSSSDGGTGGPPVSWVHAIFEGVLTNETKCLCCETVSNRDEPFMDLSLDVQPNSSLSACLKSFSSTEVLSRKNKFFCEACNSLQEAEKLMRLKRLPPVLVLHLKRFKFVEQAQAFTKLSHRVMFPMELRMSNMTAEAAEEADRRLYHLFAVVVHIGRGPNHGHYVALIKSSGKWLLFDDDLVEVVDESVLQECYGFSRPSTSATSTGYLLFYSDAPEGGQ